MAEISVNFSEEGHDNLRACMVESLVSEIRMARDDDRSAWRRRTPAHRCWYNYGKGIRYLLQFVSVALTPTFVFGPFPDDVQFYGNGVAGLHIMGSNNFTFEATYSDDWTEEDNSKGGVGNLDWPQPIEIVIEGSSLLTFTDMRVMSDNGKMSPLGQISINIAPVARSRASPKLMKAGIFARTASRMAR